MTGTWDDDDRAIARALGADADGDPAGVDADAVAEYRAALAQLPFDEVAPAPALEDRVVAAALSRRPAASRSIEAARSARRRTVPVRGIAAGAAIAAAAAIVVVLAVGRPATTPGAPAARIEPASASGDLARVLAGAGTRTAPLRAPSGAATAGKVALAPDGQGYLYDLAARAVPSARWLWLDTAGGPVRVGRLGAAPIVHFVVHGDRDAIRGVFVTTEVRPGAPSVPGRVIARATFAVS